MGGIIISKVSEQPFPKKRSGGFIDWLDKRSLVSLVVRSIGAYLVVVFFFTALEFAFHQWIKIDLVFYKDQPVSNVFEILYFNFITILTVGYGDYSPMYVGQLFSVVESFLGVTVFTLFLAMITTKALLPSKNTIVFSKYAYYCVQQKRFLIIFLNTSKSDIINVQISSYCKLDGDWTVKPAVTTPFITKSVQTFYIDSLQEGELLEKCKDNDCLRIGVVGDIGLARYSTSIEYPLKNIIMLYSRHELVKYTGFHEPDLSKLPDQFMSWFNYKPEGSKTVEEYIELSKETNGLGTLYLYSPPWYPEELIPD